MSNPGCNIWVSPLDKKELIKEHFHHTIDPEIKENIDIISIPGDDNSYLVRCNYSNDFIYYVYTSNNGKIKRVDNITFKSRED